MYATIPMLLASTLAAAPQRASQGPATPQTGRPVDVSVEGLATRRTPDGTTNGGSVGLSRRRPSSGSMPLDCLASLADQASKENVEPVDARSVLEKVVDLPIATWNYKAQDDSIRHMGPMAQDFRAAFGRARARS